MSQAQAPCVDEDKPSIVWAGRTTFDTSVHGSILQAWTETRLSLVLGVVPFSTLWPNDLERLAFFGCPSGVYPFRQKEMAEAYILLKVSGVSPEEDSRIFPRKDLG